MSKKLYYIPVQNNSSQDDISYIYVTMYCMSKNCYTMSCTLNVMIQSCREYLVLGSSRLSYN